MVQVHLIHKIFEHLLYHLYYAEVAADSSTVFTVRSIQGISLYLFQFYLLLIPNNLSNGPNGEKTFNK